MLIRSSHASVQAAVYNATPHTDLIKVTSISGDHRVSFSILRSPFIAHLSLLLLLILSISEALLKILWVEWENVGMRFSSSSLRRLANVGLLWKPSEGRMVHDQAEAKSMLEAFGCGAYHWCSIAIGIVQKKGPNYEEKTGNIIGWSKCVSCLNVPFLSSCLLGN